MSVQIYDFDEHVNATTFFGFQVYLEQNGSPVDLAGATITWKFNNGQHTFTNGSGITVTALGTFQIDKQIISWGVGVYSHELWITLANGDVDKWLMGSFRLTNG